MSFCNKRNHGRLQKPIADCPFCQAKLEWQRRMSLPGTAVDTENIDELLELDRREKIFKEFAGSLGICGSTGTRNPDPGFENAVRLIEDKDSVEPSQ